MIIYVVIDTNIIVSSILKNGSIPDQIMKMVTNQLIVPLYSFDMVDEYIDVLERDKFNFSKKQIEESIEAILENGIKVESIKSYTPFIDESDRKFYDVLMSFDGDNKYLVTGNTRHYPNSPLIKTSRELLELIG